jgi:hypothetical protein
MLQIDNALDAFHIAWEHFKAVALSAWTGVGLSCVMHHLYTSKVFGWDGGYACVCLHLVS